MSFLSEIDVDRILGVRPLKFFERAFKALVKQDSSGNYVLMTNATSGGIVKVQDYPSVSEPTTEVYRKVISVGENGVLVTKWYDITGETPELLEGQPNDVKLFYWYDFTETPTTLASESESTLTPNPVTVTVGEISVLTIILKDAEGNNLSNNGGVQDVIWNASPSTISFGQTTLHNDGRITVPVTTTTTGQYTFTKQLVF